MSLPQSLPSNRRMRLALMGVLGALGALAVAAFMVWLVFFSSAAPAAPSIEAAAGVLRPSPETSPLAPPPAATAPTEATSGSGLGGTWVVDTDVGSFADGTSSWVGFRVNEVLSNIGAAEAVGRTPSVGGSLDVAGTTLQRASIEADLTGIRSDESRRDPAIQRALETGDFPTASFESSGPVELGSLPGDGETISVTVPGMLTIHGVSHEVSADMEARLVDDVVVVVGSLPVDFTAFGVSMPTAPIVVSVEESGDLEWQLFLTRDS